MSNFSNSQSAMEDFFGPAISTYSRAQAIEDGFLIDVSSTAREAGIKFPVAVTAEAWADAVAWSDADTKRKGVPNDEAGRLWDLLWMLRMAINRTSGDTLRYQFYRVPRDGKGRKPRLVTMKAVCGPGDDAEPTIVVMLPNQD